MDVAEALAREGYRVIAIDLPPFGMSPHDPQARYSRQDQARRIQGLMSALSLSGTIIVGHSFGAGPVVETALRYGARIGGMVLIDAALGLPDDGARPATTPAPLAWMLGQPVLLESLIAATATNPLFTRSLLRTMLHRKDAADERQTAILQLPLYNQGATAALARWLPNLLLTDSNALSAQPDNYRSLQLPTAILWGTRDTITPLPQGERLARLIPGATFTTIEDVGHIPHIEDPPALIARLRAALADLTTRARRSSSTKP